jgi:hypothetical protein
VFGGTRGGTQGREFTTEDTEKDEKRDGKKCEETPVAKKTEGRTRCCARNLGGGRESLIPEGMSYRSWADRKDRRCFKEQTGTRQVEVKM